VIAEAEFFVFDKYILDFEPFADDVVNASAIRVTLLGLNNRYLQ
jgi:hypothetical protein